MNTTMPPEAQDGRPADWSSWFARYGDAYPTVADARVDYARYVDAHATVSAAFADAATSPGGSDGV